MVITRSQAGSRQPLDPAASPRANPPRRAQSHTSSIPQKSSSEGGVSCSTRTVGGGSATSLAAGNEPEGTRHCRSDCMTCPYLNRNPTVTSFVTGRIYPIRDIDLSSIRCKLRNYVYLLTCLSCGVQYVGESIVPVNLRMNVHRKGKSGCEILIDHFSNVCPGSNFSIDILEKLPGNGYTNGSIDAEMRKYRLEREDYWIKTLRTVYPYGLNDRTKSIHSDTPVGKLFPPLPRHGNKFVDQRKRTHRNSTHSHADLDLLLEQINQSPILERGNTCRKILDSFQQKHLRKLALEANKRLDSCSDQNKRWLDLIVDTFFTKIFKEEPPKKLKSRPKYIFPIYFDNKGLQFLRLNRILHEPDVKSKLPPEFREDDSPSIVYSLSSTIRNKILNYKDTVSNIDINNVETFGTGLHTCDCSSSEFVDHNHGHVLTGDLRIIENIHLRELIQKGPNYREPRPINWKRCRDTIKTGLDECSERMLCGKDIRSEQMAPWKNEILKKVDDKIRSIKIRIHPKKTRQILKRPDVVEYLDKLHKKFVLVSIDKAGNNIAIICKRYYVEVILKEIGQIGNGNSTYEKTSRTVEDVVEDNMMYSERLGLEVDDREKDLPSMYWIPKMHKDPPGARFIIASKQCVTKKISKSVSSAFKLMFNQIENFHKKAKFLSNYNKFWVIQNPEPVLESIKRINRKKGAKSLATFDFSTLYTKLPHDKLVKELLKLIDFCFNGGKKTYIKINKWGRAFWGKKTKDSIGFTKNQLKVAVKHLIENCYFSVGNTVLRQAIGIPMGIDPAPFWANLFLYAYEFNYMSDLIASDKVKARHFHSIKRFIDDLLALNDGGEFGRVHKDIYPSELELKVEHSGSHASFLNLYISIIEGIFVYKLFDKRDDFPFNIVRMPYVSSNIPESIFYSAMVGEFLRIARSTLLFSDFLPKTRELIHRLKNQGAVQHTSMRHLRKIIQRHPDDFSHFRIDTEEMLSQIFD